MTINQPAVDNPTKLQDLIDLVQTQMIGLDAESEEFAQKNAQLEMLYKMKASNKAGKISADTLAVICGNLLGIGLILGYERAHVVTTKALGFILKAKV